MYEVIPVGLGIVFALAVSRLVDTRLRNVIIAAYSVVIGVAVAAATGEFAESWAFALFDISQVAFASVVTLVALAKYRAAQRG